MDGLAPAVPARRGGELRGGLLDLGRHRIPPGPPCVAVQSIEGTVGLAGPVTPDAIQFVARHEQRRVGNAQAGVVGRALGGHGLDPDQLGDPYSACTTRSPGWASSSAEGTASRFGLAAPDSQRNFARRSDRQPRQHSIIGRGASSNAGVPGVKPISRHDPSAAVRGPLASGPSVPAGAANDLVAASEGAAGQRQ